MHPENLREAAILNFPENI